MRTRGKETQRAILRAAERVFAERGYAGARMDDVAKEVGIKRASMVYYFRDKRTLYRELLQDLFEGLFGQYQAVLEGPGTVAERILGCIDVWARHVQERPGMVRIFMWEFALAHYASAPPLAAEFAPIAAMLGQAIQAGQTEGVFRELEPMRLFMEIGGATAFLTLGMPVLAGDSPLAPDDLRSELRSLTRRLLFRD
jgi:TetR/AcrR family transcriptional regulator